MKKNDRRKRKLQEEACDYEIERTLLYIRMLKTIYFELFWRKEQFLLRKLSELPDTV